MLEISRLILRYGKDDSETQDFPVTKTDILIGRAAECDIHLDDQQVSRFHANLKVAEDGMWLLDMDSRNGTLIDEKPIPPNRRIALQPEQSFRVGNFMFKLVSPQSMDINATMIQPGLLRGYMYELESLRANEFPHMLDQVNLDNAASAPPPNRTLTRIKQALDEQVVTSQWHIGKYPLELLGSFMSSAAAFINAESPNEIVFVPGCSMGLNLIAQSLDLKAGENVVFCDLEFPANVYPWLSLQRDGVKVKQVPSVFGGLTLDALRAAVDEHTRVVTVSAVQFFSGHRTDLAALGKFCREQNIIFVVDAIQAIGHIPIDVRKMNIDVLVTGGHKSLMVSPGTGFMYVREAVCEKLKPRVVGTFSTVNWLSYLDYDMTPHPGAWRFMISTPSIEGIAGMIESMAFLNELTREATDWHTTRLAARALKMAQERGYPLTTVQGEHGSIATFKSKLDKNKTMALLQKIHQEEKIAIAQRTDRQGDVHLRMSFHCYNTEEELARAFEALEKYQ